MSTQSKVSYFNTLIFTIITGIASLILLTLLFFNIGKEFIYAIITFEVGIFAIIAYCITQIIIAESNKSKKTTSYVINFDQCPDYYTKKIVNGVEYCFNEYMGKDEAGNNYVMKISPAEVNHEPRSLPATVTVSDTVTGQSYLDVFELRKLQDDPNFKTMEEKCALVSKAPVSLDAKYTPHTMYTYMPWTYAQSRCQSLTN